MINNKKKQVFGRGFARVYSNRFVITIVSDKKAKNRHVMMYK